MRVHNPTTNLIMIQCPTGSRETFEALSKRQPLCRAQ